MNIKIKSSGISCLFSEDYDKIYAALRKKLSPDHAILFSERIPGYEYLQWVLPGEGWFSFKSCDPILKRDLTAHLDLLREGVKADFGNNQLMAQRVLTVPDDSFIYFRMNTDGQFEIKLTVWGYRYPERVKGVGVSGQINPQTQTAHVVIVARCDGEPHPGYPLKLNGYPRLTDEQGMFDIGFLPQGYRFSLEANGKAQQIEVTDQDRIIEIDTTRYTQVTVGVTKDEKPLSGQFVSLSYGKHTEQLVTDAAGNVNVTLPLGLKGGPCTVEVEDQQQQKDLDGEHTQFQFVFTTPPVQPPVEPEVPPVVVEEPHEDPPVVVEDPHEDPPVVVEEPHEDPPVVVEDPHEDPPVVVEEPHEDPPVVAEDPSQESTTPRFVSYLLQALALLSLVALICTCYFICGEAFFG